MSAAAAPTTGLSVRAKCLATRLWRLGMDTHSIAKRIGVSEACIYNYLSKRGA